MADSVSTEAWLDQRRWAALEVNMMMNVLAAGMEISDEDLKTLRARSVREVKQTNGRISFKDAIDYQRGVE